MLVCGTCLNFYGIADKLRVGTVSNICMTSYPRCSPPQGHNGVKADCFMDYCVITLKRAPRAPSWPKAAGGHLPRSGVMPVLRRISGLRHLGALSPPNTWTRCAPRWPPRPCPPGEYGFYGVTGGGKTLSTPAPELKSAGRDGLAVCTIKSTCWQSASASRPRPCAL